MFEALCPEMATAASKVVRPLTHSLSQSFTHTCTHTHTHITTATISTTTRTPFHTNVNSNSNTNMVSYATTQTAMVGVHSILPA